ncbi:MAG: pyrroline-5-carboxylate reductase [Rhodospirillales bacterium]|jgi:pyrroline-5-carboxylate reductase|nr:pyrroline-5-carboxylate reductase [Rhodospirillales bacterium]
MAEGLLLVGCGKMGGALLEGWLKQGMDGALIQVVEPHEEARTRCRALGVACHEDQTQLAKDFAPATLVFAVKPQAMDEVVPAYGALAQAGAVVMSIAAGRPIAYFVDKLGDGGEVAVVRVMPNTPAAVGRGISVLCANQAVKDEAKKVCSGLMEAVGEASWIEDEALMDAVTAVSGSGPAYVFLLAECLGAAGEAVGLPAGLAQKLARATIAGSGELLHLASESPEELRQNVTSPGGTTHAALQILMGEDGLGPLMRQAVARATQRSRELAG